MPQRSLCPKCYSDSVKPVTMWQMAAASKTVQAPPQSMYACQNPICLHKWARLSDAELFSEPSQTKAATAELSRACAHTVQRLIDMSLGDTRRMGCYF
jgi:hypothetical protein